jgi:hypothetical protein
MLKSQKYVVLVSEVIAYSAPRMMGATRFLLAIKVAIFA